MRLILDRQMFFTKNESKEMVQDGVDDYGDSFARDVDLNELKEVRFPHITQVISLIGPKIFDSMPRKFELAFNAAEFRAEFDEHDRDLGQLPGWMFEGLQLYVDQPERDDSSGISSTEQKALDTLDLRTKQACNTAKFAGATFTGRLTDEGITHVLVRTDKAPRALREILLQYVVCDQGFSKDIINQGMIRRKRLPRIVTLDWIEQSWVEKTLLDEEREMGTPTWIRSG